MKVGKPVRGTRIVVRDVPLACCGSRLVAESAVERVICSFEWSGDGKPYLKTSIAGL
jgi:hypothetical protein